MLENLKEIFENESSVLDISRSIPSGSNVLWSDHPFFDGLKVTGAIKNRAGMVELMADAFFKTSLKCDRCLEEVVQDHKMHFEHTLSANAAADVWSDLIEAENFCLDINALLVADISLELPTKVLCSEDCEGLCLACGTNLNHEMCKCDKRQLDPRLEALRKLLDN